MKDYNKVCWSCGNTNLEDMGDHVKCLKCGATYNEVCKLGPPIIKRDIVTHLVAGKEVGVGTYKPAPVVAQRARKAREKAKAK